MSKPTLLVLAALSAVLVVPRVGATTQAPNDGTVLNYAAPSEILYDFHGGIKGSMAERNVEDRGFVSEMKAQRVEAYLGYDLTRWLTVYAMGGIMSVKNNDIGLENDTEVGYGLGFWAALIDDAQLDFVPTISRYRLTASCEVYHADPNDLSWTQVDASLLFEIYNNDFLTDGTFPSGIGIFFGPIYSMVDLDGYEQVDDNEFGFTIGGDIRFADGLFVNGGFDIFNDDSIGYFQAGVRF